MEFLGTIAASPGSPAIERRRWVDLIVGRQVGLAPVAPSSGINPFTRERTLFRANPATARVVIEGEDVGAMDWSQGEVGKIDVFGPAHLVVPVALDVAAALGGVYRPWEGRRSN